MKFTRETWVELGVFVAIMLLATFLRVYRLDQLPPGLHYDSAFKGVGARRIIAGADRLLYFPENSTGEPMVMYATALAFVAFGDSVWSIRIVTALAGILNVAALYFLARSLFRSRWLAALSSFLLAILYWHINFSRLGMEPILTPAFMTLSFAFLWRALHSPLQSGGGTRWKLEWGLAGLFLGATMYTYKADLFAPILVAAFLGIEILVDRNFLRRNGRGLVIFAVIAVLVFAPLGLYFVTHPADLLDRPNAVSILSSGVPALTDNLIQVAGMFFIRGDQNPRSNLPGRPALDAFLAIGFIIGVIVCLARLRRSESRFLLLWLVVMSLPSVVTDFAPHFGRDVGVTPVLALIVAYGLATVLEKARDAKPRIAWMPIAAYGLVFAGLAFSAYSNIHDYFSVWAGDPGLFESFDAGYLDLANALRDRPANESLFISPVDHTHYTIQFGLAGRAAASFDGRQVLVLPPPGAAATYGIVTHEDSRSLPILRRIFPQGSRIETIYDDLGISYATLFRAEGAPQLTPQHRVDARMGDTFSLIAYDETENADTITVTVYWRSLVLTDEDYTVFVHLLGPTNPATQSPVWAQDDSQPGGGSFATSDWQPGETIIDTYDLRVPANAPPGDYTLEIGMYDPATLARLPVFDANGARVAQDRVLLGAARVQTQ